jgi:hypothetical protein
MLRVPFSDCGDGARRVQEQRHGTHHGDKIRKRKRIEGGWRPEIDDSEPGWHPPLFHLLLVVDVVLPWEPDLFAKRRKNSTMDARRAT